MNGYLPDLLRASGHLDELHHMDGDELVAHTLSGPRLLAESVLSQAGLSTARAELAAVAEAWEGRLGDEVDLAFSILEVGALLEVGLTHLAGRPDWMMLYVSDALELGRLEERLKALQDAPDYAQRVRSARGGQALAKKAEARWKAATLAEAVRIRGVNASISSADLAERLEQWVVEARVENPPKRSTLRDQIRTWEAAGRLARSSHNPLVRAERG